MNENESHAQTTARNILNGILETWREGHTIEECITIAARVLGTDERTISNAMLYALTGGQGFVPTSEGAVHYRNTYRYAG